MKDIQRLRYATIVERVLAYGFPLYTAHYYDFRGRIYPRSAIGFMYLKIVRGCFTMGRGKLDEGLLFASKYYASIMSHDIKVNEALYDGAVTGKDSYFMRVILLEVGKLRKREFASGKATLVDLIRKGEESLMSNDTSWLDVDEAGYFFSLRDCFRQFKDHGSWRNITIIRDSTASSFQHWGRALGVKPGFHAMLNLKGHVWYDTYTSIIQMFLNKHPEYAADPRIRHLLNRKHLKSSIMIVNYNAGRLRCISSFLGSLKDDGLYDEANKSAYTEVISKFHQYLSDELFAEVYQRSKAEFLAAHFESLKLDDAEIRLAYQETTDVKEVVKVGGDR